MNVVQCQNGHFFDADSYSVCPHCGSAITDQTAEQHDEPQEKRKFWGLGKRKEKRQITPSQLAPVYEQQPSAFPEHEEYTAETPTDTMQENFTDSKPEPKKDLTLDFWNTSAHDEVSSEKIDTPVQISEPLAEPQVQTTEPVVTAPAAVLDHPTSVEQPVQSSLRDVVQKVSSSGGGKTMSYFSSAVESKNEESQAQRPIDPVVGWIVCISGLHLGESFAVHAGKNSVGRELENDIVIGRDSGVSRIKHAIIIYEPKKRNFYLQPGESSGLTYLNDEYIMESKALQRGDIIELGNSQFLFVPLCGDDFSWEKYIKKEN